MQELPKELFTFEKAQEDAEGLTTKPISFWQDSMRRLFKNYVAVVSLLIIVVLFLTAIIAPVMSNYTLTGRVNDDYYKFAQLPPRVPVLENFGLFDGTLIKEFTQGSLNEVGYAPDEYKIVGTFTRNRIEYLKVKEYTYKYLDIEDRYFIFGTDILSRDIWTRVWYGTSISLLIGVYAAIIDVLIGVVYGGIAGFFGGTKIDDVMMRILEVLYGIPSIVILFVLFMFLTPGIVPIAIAIALTGWIGVARMIRAQFLKLRDQEFVLAARTLGASDARIIMKHLIPNVVAQIIVMVSFSIPSAIFYEAFLAFIGIGLDLSKPSLGVLINDAISSTQGAMTYVYQLVLPSLVLSTLMLSINLLGNGLRDALDPRMRNN
ncbi:MAG TPA: peptide ABC transporter permease [Erysipelotrichaceae bacterium]|nr:peptide ABC transporter permease [Erysipelotrichaceae bacterium]